MAITKKLFGKTSCCGKEVYSYTLDNGNGLSAEILNLGGIVRSLYVTTKDGRKIDVVLGRDSFDEYLKNDGYIGALIGRHANRIKNGEFELNGVKYHVGINEGKNSLHGGVKGFDTKIWQAYEGGTDEEPALTLRLYSKNGDEGFPGGMDVSVIYKLTKENALRIEYRALSDADTLCNMTNHSYFNLGGHDSGLITNQVLQINADFYTPNDSECMPTGEVLSVTGTPFDYRAPKPIGQDIDADFPQIQAVGGFDHNYMIAGRGFRKAAAAVCEETGIVMEVYTDQPAMQLYTANALPNGVHKNGSEDYPIHGAFCLETQCVPNAMEFSHYPGPVLKEDVIYKTFTEYKFIVK